MQAPVSRSPAPYPTVAPYASGATGRRRCAIPEVIRHVFVPLAVLNATSDVMRLLGEQRRECYVWWGGFFTGDGLAQVSTVYFPAVQTHFGRVAFGMADFHRLHAELRRRDQILLAELHTHPPGAGGQNEVDAAHAAAPYPGFITIVVPDFASPNFYDLRDCYVYRYVANNQWEELGPADIQAMFIVDDTFVTVE